MGKNKSIISRFQDLLETQKGQTILNYLYSWGAAVVILGALFKLTHIEGADLMLFLGMGTEVITFIVNGFERQSSVKESADTPIASGSSIVIGGAPIVGGVAAGTVDAASCEASQLDADALNAMANMVAANASLAAVQGATSQLDADALSAMANMATANASLAAAQGAIPVVDGKVDIPELQQVTQNYIEKLRELTESFQHISVQSTQLEASADEVERLSRNLTSINTIYEMHLKSLGSQIGNIDLVNEQTRRMAEQIEELNQVYDRMLQSMTVNMNINRHANEPGKEA